MNKFNLKSGSIKKITSMVCKTGTKTGPEVCRKRTLQYLLCVFLAVGSSIIDVSAQPPGGSQTPPANQPGVRPELPIQTVQPRAARMGVYPATEVKILLVSYQFLTEKALLTGMAIKRSGGLKTVRLLESQRQKK